MAGTMKLTPTESLTAGPEPLVRGPLAALAPLGRVRGYGGTRGRSG